MFQRNRTEVGIEPVDLGPVWQIQPALGMQTVTLPVNKCIRLLQGPARQIQGAECVEVRLRVRDQPEEIARGVDKSVTNELGLVQHGRRRGRKLSRAGKMVVQNGK